MISGNGFENVDNLLSETYEKYRSIDGEVSYRDFNGAADRGVLDRALLKLDVSIERRRPGKSCLQLWSHFVRLRDGFSCVRCGSEHRVSAHHICRKSFMPEAAFQVGNGITLCYGCHRIVHRGYNGRPDLNMPMDGQGGEKIDIMEDLYGRLFVDGERRNLLDSNYYYLSDSVLAKFKMFQGFDWSTPFPGSRIEQAYLIWRQSPKGITDAILAANGFPNLSLRPPLRGGALIISGDGSRAYTLDFESE
ncbi:hypothetical protein ABE438_16150 [Bosea sp. TWI1241]|uniref:HNH endonuclease n=1 Tax=Bosea sp. TWI1241 TaxID=3148904 RepID=UPI003207EC43